jgi:hypothetical protein
MGHLLEIKPLMETDAGVVGEGDPAHGGVDATIPKLREELAVEG